MRFIAKTLVHLKTMGKENAKALTLSYKTIRGVAYVRKARDLYTVTEVNGKRTSKNVQKKSNKYNYNPPCIS